MQRQGACPWRQWGRRRWRGHWWWRRLWRRMWGKPHSAPLPPTRALIGALVWLCLVTEHLFLYVCQ